MHYILLVVFLSQGATHNSRNVESFSAWSQEFNTQGACEWARNYVLNVTESKVKAAVCAPKGF